MWLSHVGMKNGMVNSQPPEPYIFFWLLLWCIANDTEKSKLFVNLVLHHLQKSHVSVLDWSLIGKPSRKGLKEKERVCPRWKTGLLWKPYWSVWHTWACSPSFHRLPTQRQLWALSSPIGWGAFSSWLIQPVSCTKSTPSSPAVGPREVVMLTWGWGVMGVRAGMLPQVSSMVLLGAQSHLRCWTQFLWMW